MYLTQYTVPYRWDWIGKYTVNNFCSQRSTNSGSRSHGRSVSVPDDVRDSVLTRRPMSPRVLVSTLRG